MEIYTKTELYLNLELTPILAMFKHKSYVNRMFKKNSPNSALRVSLQTSSRRFRHRETPMERGSVPAKTESSLTSAFD